MKNKTHIHNIKTTHKQRYKNLYRIKNIQETCKKTYKPHKNKHRKHI